MSDYAPVHRVPVNPPAQQSAIPAQLRAAGRLFMASIIILGIIIALGGDIFLGNILGFVGFLGWRGFKCGAIRSICALAGVLCMFAWAVPAGKAFSGKFHRWFSLPVVPCRYISILIMAILFFVSGLVVGRIVHWWYRRYFRYASRRAHAIGMIVGMVEGAVLTIIILIAIVAVEPPVRIALSVQMEKAPWAQFLYAQELRVKEQKENTAIGHRLATAFEEKSEVLETGGALATVLRIPGTAERLKRSEVFKELLDSEPSFERVKREIKSDYELIEAVKKGDIREILNSTTVLHLLEDEKLAVALAEHRDELFITFLDSVPDDFKERASRELAKLRGVPLEEMPQLAKKRLEEIRDQVQDLEAVQVDQAIEQARERGEDSILEMLEGKTEEEIIKDLEKQAEQAEKDTAPDSKSEDSTP